MSKADKMLYDLGLEKEITVSPLYEDKIIYNERPGYFQTMVTFSKFMKCYWATGRIDVPLQIAINEKMKELGWLDE